MGMGADAEQNREGKTGQRGGNRTLGAPGWYWLGSGMEYFIPYPGYPIDLLYIYVCGRARESPYVHMVNIKDKYYINKYV